MAKAKGRKSSKDRTEARRSEPDLGGLDSFTRKILKVPKEKIEEREKRRKA